MVRTNAGPNIAPMPNNATRRDGAIGQFIGESVGAHLAVVDREHAVLTVDRASPEPAAVGTVHEAPEAGSQL
jgi:hypothetical protein